ncbi:hypothetical protein ONE63_009314 [Megalurothrips usitatus]|uniref:limulus clotting factor C n=1 Tax=Megalurothrips usitatus TaxID=439358 RepID=A0AAV7XQW3_9NEOP|nr:hypothetical protein ONE63_009314 [Megalurothrips usitatus]
MRAAPRLLGALLLLQVLQLQLHGCLAIYDPDDDGAGTRGPPEVDDDEGAGVITVHAGKRKPPAGSWGAPPPPPPPPAVVGRGADCPPAGRKRRSPAKSKPLPVRQKIKRQANNYHCPDSWKDLDFSEVQELECPQNATGWFPFPPDCRKYLNCWKGRGFLQACAPATVFHPIRRECDYPEKVKCLPSCRSEPEDSGSQDGDVIGGDPTDYVDPEDPDAVSPLLDLRSVPAGPVRRVPPPTPAPAGRDRRGRRAVYDSGRLQCLMEGGTGLAPHPTECSKFVNCWQGKPHIQGCAPGTLFNPRLNACDHPHKVPECVNGKRDPSRLAAGQRAQGGGDGGGDGGREGAVPTHHGGGGYHQFGNQGYQPPPRQTFNTGYGARDGDQVPAASSFQGYGPNQVAPPPGRDGPKGKGLQPRPGAQDFSEPNLDAETIASAGVIGPLPGGHGHSEAWHREHGRGMPGQGPPHHHHQQHHHYHHQHTPLPDYTPTPTWHSSNPGGYSGGRQPASYTPQPAYNPGRDYTPQTGAYSPARDYTPQSGAHAHGHNPQWHYDHGVPMPGGHHHHNYNHHNHNPEWHSAHGVPMPGQGQYGGRRDPEPYPEYETTTAGYTPPTTTCAPESADFDDDGYDGDVDLLDVRTGDASNWISVVDRTKNSSMPQSGQMVRLRGGSTALEGYVEVMGPGSRWGSVCDKPAGWTVEEASVVCRSLGYERGAELAWQGRPRGQRGVLPVHVEEVRCSGGEHSLMSCDMNSGDAGDGCNLETQAAGLRCYPNFAAKCRSGEVQYKGSCYSMVVPRQDRKVDAIAFSQDEAIKHCRSQGGHLLDINNQAEGDFVSEWLSTSYPALSSVLTAGVGVSVPGRSVWVWESSGAPVQYNLWWPGPPSKEQDSARAPKVGERPLCVLLKKDFPCESWPGGGGGGRGYGGAGYGSWQGARSCSAEYFFWHAEDCAIRQKSYPYVCERKADDIGCRGATEYAGPANVSWNGAPCVSWDNPAVVATLRYRVTEDVRLKELAGHNRCRMAGSQEPWCFVDAGASGIREARCDIPVCRENAAISRAAIHCGPQQFECGPNECIPNVWQCDGERDCSNGQDELACANYLLQFRQVKAAKLEKHDVERWLHLDANTCARRCLDSTDFKCKSFSYKTSTKVCLLSGHNVGETGALQRANRTAWDYFERLETAEPCDAPDRFACANGKCVNATATCNGCNDCGDRSDEADAVCTASTIGYELRLAGGKAKNEGRIEVRVKGVWGAVCDDGFGLPEADVVCREAGYRDGAVEVLSGGILPAPLKPTPILVDELVCAGNETSLMRCDHAGWGVHDCTPEEMVGVRCATAAGLECRTADTASPELHGGFAWGAILQLATKHCQQSTRACPENQWQCESGECVPSTFLCDTVDDCKDGSDEHAKRCAEPMELRLAGGANQTEGRLEVRVYGEWGTVCDDDFTEAAAMLVCRQLGMPGRAVVHKEAHFGQGQGLIWMDSVQCAGNETALENCRHEDFGVTNCKHDEDVGVSCLGGDERTAARALEEDAQRPFDVTKYLPEDCGQRQGLLEDAFVPAVQLTRVVLGRGTPKGAYPWQASIRVRAGLKSVHWCGAVVVGPLHVLTAAHCVQDYTKGAYFIRAGDYNSEDDDGSEQEANIESIHVHEDFNKNVYLENDLAVIRVASPGFRMTEHVQPACLPKRGTPYSPGTNCSISGWGSVGTSGSGYSRLLRSAWLPILATDECSAPDVYGKRAIVEGMFCAGHLGGGADSCQGDSGGPMVCQPDSGRFTLFGITSWGHGCGMAKKPGVYSSVAHYLDWVHSKIQESVRGMT